MFGLKYQIEVSTMPERCVYETDLTLWMMDNYKPKLVVGSVFKKLGGQKECGNMWGDWDAEKITVEDSAFGYIVMQNGAAISLESAWALNTLDVIEAKTTLCGTKAGADMRDGLRINRVKYNKWTTEQLSLIHISAARSKRSAQSPCRRAAACCRCAPERPSPRPACI